MKVVAFLALGLASTALGQTSNVNLFQQGLTGSCAGRCGQAAIETEVVSVTQTVTAYECRIKNTQIVIPCTYDANGNPIATSTTILNRQSTGGDVGIVNNEASWTVGDQITGTNGTVYEWNGTNWIPVTGVTNPVTGIGNNLSVTDLQNMDMATLSALLELFNQMGGNVPTPTNSALPSNSCGCNDACVTAGTNGASNCCLDYLAVCGYIQPIPVTRYIPTVTTQFNTVETVVVNAIPVGVPVVTTQPIQVNTPFAIPQNVPYNVPVTVGIPTTVTVTQTSNVPYAVPYGVAVPQTVTVAVPYNVPQVQVIGVNAPFAAPYAIAVGVPSAVNIVQNNPIMVTVAKPYTVQNVVAVPVGVPLSVPVGVAINRPEIVTVNNPVGYAVPIANIVEKPVPQTVVKPIYVANPVIEIVPVGVGVPVANPSAVTVAVPVAVPVNYVIEVPVMIPVDVPYNVPVNNPSTQIVQQNVPVTVNNPVIYNVDEIYNVPYTVQVNTPVTVARPVNVEQVVNTPIAYEVQNFIGQIVVPVHLGTSTTTTIVDVTLPLGSTAETKDFTFPGAPNSITHNATVVTTPASGAVFTTNVGGTTINTGNGQWTQGQRITGANGAIYEYQGSSWVMVTGTTTVNPGNTVTGSWTIGDQITGTNGVVYTYTVNGWEVDSSVVVPTQAVTGNWTIGDTVLGTNGITYIFTANGWEVYVAPTEAATE